MFVTQELRENAGQFIKVKDRAMLAMGIERMGTCQACGHSIKRHFGIKSPAGDYLWVGSQCVDTLTRDDIVAEDVAPGMTWTDDGREYIVPSAEWLEQLRIAAHGATYCAGKWRGSGVPVYNQFYSSILKSFGRYGQLTIKQYNAVDKDLAIA